MLLTVNLLSCCLTSRIIKTPTLEDTHLNSGYEEVVMSMQFILFLYNATALSGLNCQLSFIYAIVLYTEQYKTLIVFTYVLGNYLPFYYIPFLWCFFFFRFLKSRLNLLCILLLT